MSDNSVKKSIRNLSVRYRPKERPARRQPHATIATTNHTLLRTPKK